MSAAAPSRENHRSPIGTSPIGTSLIECILHVAELDPERDAVVSTGAALSYQALAQRVLVEAERLDEAGIASDAIVGIRCPDDAEHLVLCMACMHVGAASFAIPSHETRESRELLLSRCGATHVVDGQHIVATTATPRAPAAEARVFFATSGTSGEPKLVVHHASDLVAQAHRHIDSIEERFACLASIEHNFAKRHRLYCAAIGATNVFLDAPRESLVDQCLALNVNVLHVTVFQAQELLAVPGIERLSAIRLKLGGSHVPLALRQQLQAKITNTLQAGYGTTETGAIGFTDPDDRNAGESVGRPLPGIDVRVLDADGEKLPPGKRGELAIRCDGMFRGYLDNDAATRERLRDDWFHTGDIGYVDSHERIHVCGRVDDMFVFNSMNIYPQDIESRICEFPGVSEALVLPKPSLVHGNIPVAFVVFESGAQADLSALKAFVRKHAGVRSPRQYESVETLPRNASGKVSRRDALTLPQKNERIRRSIIGALSVDSVKRLKRSVIAAFECGDGDISLEDAGLDSFARMELLVMLEVEFDVVITPEDFTRFRTLGDFSAWVLSPPDADSASAPERMPAISGVTAARRTDDQSRTLRLFKRTFRYCHTVAQLNKALTTLEHRLTPLDVAFLHEQFVSGQLVSSTIAEKFRTALSVWFARMNRLMDDSGKTNPEPFVAHRITPTASHYVGPGRRGDKTLLVCFANMGSRHLMMPNAVLMQHTDAARYDLLVIGEPLIEGYRLGVPTLGRNVDEVIEWIRKREFIGSYRAVRTVGCSAGAYMAVIAGFRLGAEMAVSVAGRFHAERYLHRIVGRIITTWRTARTGHCDNVVMSYPDDDGKTRDRIYARVIGRLTNGRLFGVKFTDGFVGHRILERLVERGELIPYFANTVFAGLENASAAANRNHTVLSLPDGNIRDVA